MSFCTNWTMENTEEENGLSIFFFTAGEKHICKRPCQNLATYKPTHGRTALRKRRDAAEIKVSANARFVTL